MSISEEQQLFFKSLPEQKKVIRLEKAIGVLVRVGRYQLELLDKYHSSSEPKEIGFGYFYPTVQSIWENTDFALSLGKGKFRHFGVYPARLICESVFRLEYYINQRKDQQNEICFWEMARLMKRFYDEFGDEEFKNQYNGMIRDLGNPDVIYPKIEEDIAYTDKFPKIKVLIEASKLPTAKNFYPHYQFLCESHHGKLLSLHIAKDRLKQYRFNLFYILLFLKWLLLIIDAYIQKVTKSMVDDAIRKADEIVFSTP